MHGQNGLSDKSLCEAKFVQLQAMLEIARRHLIESMQRCDPLSNPPKIRASCCVRV